MKNKTTPFKLILGTMAFLAAAGCDFSPNAMMGGGYGYNSDYGYSEGFSSSCTQGELVLSKSSMPAGQPTPETTPTPDPSGSPTPDPSASPAPPASASAAPCAPPNNVISSISADTDGSLEITTLKTSDGQFPEIASLTYAQQPALDPVIVYDCVGGTPGAVTRPWKCTPRSGSYQIAPQGYDSEAVYFHSMTLVNPTCGEVTVYQETATVSDYCSTYQVGQVDYAWPPILYATPTQP